jgi:5'-3' exonuclease
MNEPHKWYKGKQLFITIEWATSYILLFVIMFLIILGLVEYIWLFGLIVFIYLLSFVAVQQYIIRKHLEEHGGETILDTFTDTDFDQGEDFLFPIAKIDEFPDISPSARNAVNKFMMEMQNYFNIHGYVNLKRDLGELDKAIEVAEESLMKEGTPIVVVNEKKKLPNKKGGKK